MRIAPVGLVADDPFRAGCDFAAITHGHPTGWFAAGAMAVMIARLLAGAELDVAIDAAQDRLRFEPDADETLEALGAARRRAVADLEADSASPEAVESLGQGWIAEEALAISVYCALVAPDFEMGVLLAVNHGGDSDSTGAITGNIFGTLHGVGAIPAPWLDEFEARDVIEALAGDLVRLVDADGSAPAVVDATRYPPW